MPIYPTPRLLIILGLGIPAAIGVALYVPSAWPWVPLIMALMFVLAILDGFFAPVGQGVTFEVTFPKSMGVGREQTQAFSLRFTKWRQPQRIELRLGLNPLLAASSYDRHIDRGADSAFRGMLTLKARARGQGEIDAAYIRWQGFLGLVYVQTRITLDKHIAITPDLKGVEQDASDLFSLDNIYGIRVQNQLYNGSEYHALREYDASQDHRRIDWRSSARHGRAWTRRRRCGYCRRSSAPYSRAADRHR